MRDVPLMIHSLGLARISSAAFVGVAAWSCAASPPPSSGSNDADVAPGMEREAAADTSTIDASSHDSGMAAIDSPDEASGLVNDANGNGEDAAKRDGASNNGDGEAGVALGCSSLPFCDDFEKETTGGPPDPSVWTVTTGCGMTDPTSTVTVDGTQSNSGKKSIKVVGGTNTCGPLLTNTTAFASLGDTVYGRFFARFTSGMPMQHTALLVLGLSADAGVAQNPSNGLQLTGQSQVLVWNWHDTTLPNIDTQGTSQSVDPPLAPQWVCIEFETSATTGAIAAWVDGSQIAGLTFDPTTTTLQPGANNTWSSGHPTPLRPASISFGWVSYGGGTNTVWFDDVALSGSRIGCTP
jgi:hypothetical protein